MKNEKFNLLLIRKLVTTVVSSFTAHYIHQWNTYFPSTPLQPRYLPSFDGRAVIYPNTQILRDYMSWRQVDCKYYPQPFFSLMSPLISYDVVGYLGHINNLYNTTFWAMVLQGGMSNTDAEQELKVCILYSFVLKSYISISKHNANLTGSTREPCHQTRTRFSSSGSELITIMNSISIRRAVLSIARYVVCILCILLHII